MFSQTDSGFRNLKEVFSSDSTYYARLVASYLQGERDIFQRNFIAQNLAVPVFVTIMRQNKNIGCSGVLFTNQTLKSNFPVLCNRARNFDLRHKKGPFILQKGDVIWVHFPYKYRWIDSFSEYATWKVGIKLGNVVVFPSEGKTRSYIKRNYLKYQLAPPYLIFSSLDFKYKVIR